MEYFNIINQEYYSIIKSKIFNPMVRLEFLDNLDNPYENFTFNLEDTNGTLNESYQQGVRKTTSFSIVDKENKFFPDPTNRNIWFGKRFNLKLGVSKMYENGEKTFWFDKGIFLIKGLKSSNDSGVARITVEGADKFSRFTSDTGYAEMVKNFIILRDTKLDQAIRDILIADSGTGFPIDSLTPLIDPMYRNLKIPYEIQKNGGSYIGDMLIELATMYKAELFYDEGGHLNFTPSMIGDEMRALPLVWSFEEDGADYLSPNLSYDFSKVINAVYVSGDNPNGTLPEAYVENNSLLSRFAIDKIGYRRRQFSSSTIYSQQEAQDYANYMLNYLSTTQTSLSFQSVFMPHLTVNKLIRFSNKELNLENEDFMIQSIAFSFGSGTCSLTCCNVKDMPQY